MASTLDRALQRRLLGKIAEAYPSSVRTEDLGFAQSDTAWSRT